MQLFKVLKTVSLGVALMVVIEFNITVFYGFVVDLILEAT